jgi:hypothetical protein
MPDLLTNHMLKIAWAGMLLGVVSGAVIGLFFAREDWMGGYSSWRRRLTRLGHISFFGLGFVNFFFAFTHHTLTLDPTWAMRAAWGFGIGAAAMPTICFLSAWKKPLRHLFFIPVGGVAIGVLSTLAGWP